MEDKQDDESLMEVDEAVAGATEHYLDSTAKPPPGADMDVVPEEEDGAEAEDGATPVKRLEGIFGSAKEDAPCLQVVVRVRPIPKERETCTEVITDSMIRTTVPENSVSFKLVGPQVKEYTFNRVFRPECEQEEMYKGTTEPLVDALYMGRSGLLFAYGVTNAGKTFTIMGNEENPGILPRALGEIFSRLKRDEKTTLLAGRQCSVVASYLEVYNDQIFDLLDESGNRKALKPADRGGRIEVKGLSKREITDVQSGINLVRQGAANRQKAATKLNIDSSRSHSVFTIELVSRPIPGSSSSSAQPTGGTNANPPTALSDDAGARPADIVGTLWIVDLAGSERSNRAGHSSGKLQREASGINTSLMKLWRCLDQLRKNQSGSADGQQLLVPFRECKITHLFMNHLTGSSVGRTVMILNINPSKEDYDETAHVLNQGSGAQEIRVIKDFKREMRHRQLLGGTHDYDGRRILKRRKSADKAGSFRGTGGKAGPQPSIAEDDEEEDLSGVESDTALTTTGRKSIVIRHCRDVEQENLRMKGVEEENRLLRETVEALKTRLCLAETQIREEVAEEMAQVMSSMEHELRSLREQSLSLSSSSSSAASRRHGSSQREANPFANIGSEKQALAKQEEQGGESCTSARKIYQGRLEKRVAELEDQKQEAEEEMRRMRQRHDEEVAGLRTRIQELMERDEDRDSLDALPGMTLASLQEEADELKKELQQAKDDADHWRAIAEGKGTAAPPAAAPPSGKSTAPGAKSRKRSKSTEATTKAPQPADEAAMMDVAPASSSTAPEGPSPSSLPSPPSPPESGGSGPSAAADVMPPPAPPQQPPTNTAASAKANDDRRLKIQERVRQQLKPKADGTCPQASPAGAGQEDGAAATGPLGKTPIAKRLRSRHPAGTQDDQQEPPTV